MAKLALDSGRHAYSERADDLYETPPAAVLALLGAESLPRRIWERAAGRGAIVEVVRSTGHDVVAADLRDRGDHRCPGTTTGIESFNTLVAPDGDCILTNPPFRKSGPQPFVSHGLKLCRCVIILARLTFIESKRPILESGTWVRAMPFKSRLPMMDRDHENQATQGRVAAPALPARSYPLPAPGSSTATSPNLRRTGCNLHRPAPQKHPNADAPCHRRARRDGTAPQSEEASNA